MAINNKYQEEINFKEVVKTPARWFGLFYIYFFVLIIAAGLFYANYMGMAFRNSVPPQLTDSTIFAKQIEMKRGSVTQGANIFELAKPNDQLLTKGQELYTTNCASCHGEQGMGNGVAGAVMNPKPRNFHSKDGWINGRTFSGMFQTVKEGIAKTGMPSYDYMPVEDRVALIHYVRNFEADFPPIQQEELKLLDQDYNLSEGSVIPPTIPVNLAMVKLAEENAQKNAAAKLMILNLQQVKKDSTYYVFNESISDVQKAVQFLALNESWNNSVNDLKNLLVTSLEYNGFKTGIINLKNEEWNSLYSFLKKISNSKAKSDNV